LEKKLVDIKGKCVAIVMPVYNREKTVERSVKSIQRQIYTNWNLIIVDDNSTDGSLTIIKKIVNQDKRIKYKSNIEHSHSCAGARLSGLSDIDGDYICFLDSDDEWPDYHLQELLGVMESNESLDLVFGDLKRVDVSGKVLVESKFRDEQGLPETLDIKWVRDLGIIQGRANLATALENRFNTGMHTAMYRAKFFDDVPLRDVYGCEDALLTFEAMRKGKTLGVVKTCQLEYLVHDENVSSVSTNISVKQLEKNTLSEINFYNVLIPQYLNLNKLENLARKRKLADIYVWHLANKVYRPNGFFIKAIKYICKGIILNPFEVAYYKTLLGTLVLKNE